MTPLHLAIIGGSYKIVKGLLEYGADIELKDKLGKNGLETAIEF
jgi:ankyrin repeat protein